VEYRCQHSQNPACFFHSHKQTTKQDGSSDDDETFVQETTSTSQDVGEECHCCIRNIALSINLHQQWWSFRTSLGILIVDETENIATIDVCVIIHQEAISPSSLARYSNSSNNSYYIYY
jgi:hypothetical protein